MVTNTLPSSRGAWLLEVLNVGAGSAWVSLSPVGSTSATLVGYQTVDISYDEVARLTGELRLVLSRVNMRGALDRTAAEELRKLGHLLFDELFPNTIKDFLRDNEGGDLLLRTDESLVDVPWEVLHTGSAFLALSWNLGRLITAEGAGIATAPRELSAPYEVLVLADPCGDLDAAYEEGDSVASHLDAQTYLRVTAKTSEVSRAYVRENIREFDILHFAGHAELGGTGEGWLLSDGRFTSRDVERLCGGRPFPSLVFANACGSGKAQSPGFDGSVATYTLARSLIGAGVRHFIGAHWDVPDYIGREFADQFYRGLCHGLSVGEAMRRARLALTVRHGDATILWGSYCLYGDPHHVYFTEAGASRDAGPNLPIVDADTPMVAPGVYHTLDLPVRELMARPAEEARPYPEMRREVQATNTNVSRAVRDMRRAALVAALILVGVVAAVGIYELSPDPSPPNQAPAVAMPVESDGEAEDATPQSNVARALQVEEAADVIRPPRVDFTVTAQTRTAGDDLAEINVAAGTRLYSGDNVRIALDADRDFYGAVLMIDGSGSVQTLFPHPTVRSSMGNYVPAGDEVVLPGADLWFRLDDTTGAETVVLFASRKPIADLDGLRQDVKTLVDDQETAARPAPRDRKSVVFRGVTGITSDDAPPARSRRSRGRPAPMTDRTELLTAIQTRAHEHGVDIVQAVTYHHVR